MKKKYQSWHFIGQVLSYFFKIVITSAAAIVVGGMNLTLGLVFAGIFTVLYLLLSKRATAAFFAPNIIFIPLMYRVLSDQDMLLFPNDYQNALGQLIVAFWIAGIIHITLVIVSRYLDFKHLRRFLPPYLIGGLIVSLGFVFVLTILSQYSFSPLYNQGAFPFIDLATIIITALIAYLLKNNITRGKFIRDSYLIFVVLGGSLVYLLLEAITVGWGIVPENASLLALFRGETNLNWTQLTPFQDYGTLFGFIDNLSISPNYSIAIIPLVIIAFMEPYEAVKGNRRLVETSGLSVEDYDRIVFANGISIMSGSALALSPFYAHKFHDVRMNDQKQVTALLVGAVLILLVAPFSAVTNILGAIPRPVYDGLVLAALLALIRHGWAMIKTSVVDNPSSKNIIVALGAFIFAVFFGINQMLSAITGLSLWTLSIGNIQIDYMVIGLLFGLIMNIVLPRKHMPINSPPKSKDVI